MKFVYTGLLIIVLSALRLTAQDSCISNTITMSVISKPMIRISGGTTVCSGGSATLQANPTGGIVGDCQIKWQLSNDNGVNYQDIVGEKNKTYQTAHLTQTTYYRALYICTGVGCDSKPSEPQIITVIDKPLVSIVADQKYICQKSPIYIKASVSGGSGIPNYQWQSSTNSIDWTNLSGETSFNYYNTTLTKTTFFRVVVTEQGDGCITTSAPVQISVDGCTGTIGDFVWLDCNGDGIQNPNEKGLPGVIVTLNGTNAANLPVSLSTTTNGSGYYLFSGLQAGTYVLTFGSVPNVSGLTFTKKNAGDSLLDSDVDGSGKTDAIVLGQGEIRTDIDAGYTESVGPVFANVPKNITTDCDKIPSVQTLSALDIFGAATVVTYDSFKSPNPSGNGCVYPYTITRKWTAKDNCGKLTTAQQIITVQDTTAPVFTFVPPDVTIGCKEPIPNGADVRAKDNCDGAVQIITEQEIDRDPIKACKNYILYKIFTASDACGNNSQSVRQKITVTNTQPPVFVNVPKDATVQCDQVQDINTIIVTANDFCNSTASTITASEKSIAGNCQNNKTLQRTWTATDACGISSNFTQTLTVTDTTRPIIGKAPSDITVDLNRGDVIPPVPVIGTDITATDNCDNNPIITLTETSRLMVGNCQSQITRTWTARDVCGNESFVKKQTITIIELKPSVSIAFSKAEDCSGNNGQVTLTPSIYNFIWSDGGTGAVRNNLKAGNYNITISGSNGCDIIQQITLVKECLNCIQPILSAVKTPISCGKSNDGSLQITISNYETSNPDYKVRVSSVNGFDSSFVIHNASFPVSGLSIGNYTVKVVKAIDTACYASLSIGIENTPGVTINDAVIVNAGCGAVTGSATFNTNGINTYKFLWNDGNTQSARTNLAVRNYTVTVSNTGQCDAVKQVKIINSGVKPTVSISANPLVSCGNTKINFIAEVLPIGFYEYQWQISDDGVSWKPVVNENSSVYSNATLQKTSFFRVIVSSQNGCINISAPIKIIVNTQKPVLINVPNNITIDCNKIPAVASDVVATDNAGFKINVTSSETRSKRDAVSCQIIITRTYTAKDNCLNTATATQKITLLDTVKPLIINAPSDITVDKSKNDIVPTPPVNVVAADNCDAFVAVKFNESNSTSTGNCQSFIVRIWTATDSCGNTATRKQIITILETLPVIVASNIKPENCLDKNGSIDLTPTNLLYRWNDGITGATRNNLSAGSYTVRAYSNTNCFVQKDFNVARLCDSCKQPLVSFTKSDPICGSNTNTGVAIVNNISIYDLRFTVFDAQNNIIKTSIIGQQTASVINNLVQGNYTVKIQRAENAVCDTTIQFSIIGTNKLLVDAPVIKPAVCNSPTGSIDYSMPANIGLRFRWNDLDTNRLRTKLLPGIYVVTISDSKTNRCPVTDSLKVPLINPLHTSSTILTQPSCGQPNGVVKLTTVGGSGQYVYSWGEGDSRYVLSAGTTTVTITDVQTGCKTTETFNLINKNIQATLVLDTVAHLTCNGNADGYLKYSVTPGAGFTLPVSIELHDSQNRIYTNGALPAGKYVFQVKDATGCIAVERNVTVLQPDILAVTVIKSNQNCDSAGRVTLNVTGGKVPYRYLWSDANGITTDNATRNDLQVGNYSVSVFDAGNCLLPVKNISILDSCKCRLPVIDSIVTTPATCGVSNGIIQLKIKNFELFNKYQFDWTPDLGNPNSLGNERTALNSGVYSVIISERSNPNCFINTTVGVGSLQGPKNISVITTAASCQAANGTAIISPLPADSLTYTWLFDNSNAASRNDLKAGFYQVLATLNSSPDCPTLINVRIDSKNILTASAQTVKKATCGLSNGSIQLRIANHELQTGSYAVHISGSIDSSFIVQNNTFIVTDFKAGVYTINITDQLTRCNSVIIYTLENENIGATSILFPDTVVYTHCAASTNAFVKVQIANYGAKDSIFLIDATEHTVQSVQISTLLGVIYFNNLSVGKYCMVVKDVNNCITASKCFEVKNPLPIVAVASKTNETCTAKGSINITTTGGTGIYSYQWSDSPIILASQRTDLKAGSYRVTITDANGCNFVSDTLNIINDCPTQRNCNLNASVNVQNVTCASSGSIILTINGGIAPYKFKWSDLSGGNNPQNRTNIQIGNYAVTITDAANCSDTLKNIVIAKDSMDCSLTCTHPFNIQTQYTIACGAKAQICTQLKQADTLGYKIFDNGILYKGGFTQCEADSSVSYNYFTLVQRNSIGPWELKEWLLNGQLHKGIFYNIDALKDSMNVWDAPHLWQIDTKTYSLYSNGNTKSYNKMLWSKNGLPIAELNPSIYEQYRHYGIQLDSGTHTLIAVNENKTCRDTVIIKIMSNCTTTADTMRISCGKLIEGTHTYNVPCGEKANVCTKLSGADTLVYKVYDNGNRYTSGFTKCAADTSVSYNYFTLVLSNANGPWTLNEWLLNGQLRKGVFNTIQSLTDSMNVWDAPNKWILDAKTFTIYSINNHNICNAMLWSKNGKPIAQLMSSYDEIYRQIGLKLNIGTHQIIFENTVRHCRDTAQINVRCFPVIGGTTPVQLTAKENIDSIKVKIPRLKAFNDHAIAYQHQTVQIEPVLNDSLGGEKAIIVLVEPPTYGKAVLNRERNRVAYTPQEDPCEKRDSFRYALVTANGRDTAWITIEVVCDDLIVFTGFSPNSDGINDYFVIKGLENYKNNRLMIYNRYGNLVYETKNYQNDWDGTYNGKNLPDGTYFYIIDLGNGDQKSGYVQIQR